MKLTQKDVAGTEGSGKGDGYKVRSHFGSSLEMVLCLLGDGSFRQLATGTQKVLQSSREFHGRQNKSNRSAGESLELLSSLASGAANTELTEIVTVLDSVAFYEYAGVPTFLSHVPGATVEHPLVAESQETMLT